MPEKPTSRKQEVIKEIKETYNSNYRSLLDDLLTESQLKSKEQPLEYYQQQKSQVEELKALSSSLNVVAQTTEFKKGQEEVQIEKEIQERKSSFRAIGSTERLQEDGATHPIEVRRIEDHWEVNLRSLKGISLHLKNNQQNLMRVVETYIRNIQDNVYDR